MNLFKQLLVAPALIGLSAPLVANAAELNIDDVASYSTSPEQVSISSQLSDVVPGDWAYTALQNLSASYGCVDSAYTQSLNNGAPLTRFEAAALVNSCLEGNLIANGEGLSPDAISLSEEFGSEMAILKGRVDGLEYKVSELSAGAFSSTTKMSGTVDFVTGYLDRDNADDDNLSGYYRAKYDVTNSFTGKDQLYTRFVTGNADSSHWAESTTYGTHLSAANKNGNALKVDKIWYRFPVGDFTFWVGPRIENYYMLASSPSIYKPILKAFANGGNMSTYGSSTDGGFGAAWTQSTDDPYQARFAVSTNYVAKKANDASVGMFDDDAQTKWLSKVEYGSPRWQVSYALALHGCGSSCKAWSSYFDTAAAGSTTGDQTSHALRAYLRAEESGIVPDVQFGYDYFTVDDDGSVGATESASGWMIGLMWKDAFIDGNRLGVALGSAMQANDIVGGADDPADPLTWEAYYDYKVADSITVTPAIFSGADVYDGGDSDDFFGGLVKVTFKF